MKWNDILEELSALEHEQWEHWSRSICQQTLDGNAFNPHAVAMAMQNKHKSWLPMWVPYDDLSEELKEYDRVWGRKVLSIIAKHIEKNFGKTENTQNGN